MDHIVVRPAQPGDGRDLARGYLQSCRYYALLDPEAFQIPTTDGLIEWLETSLQGPRSQDNLWLVAELDGRVVGNVEARLERPVDDAARQMLRELGQVRVWVNLLDVDESCRRRGLAFAWRVKGEGGQARVSRRCRPGLQRSGGGLPGMAARLAG
jgi:hypothetical protein